jgi:hypothetical protein
VKRSISIVGGVATAWATLPVVLPEPLLAVGVPVAAVSVVPVAAVPVVAAVPAVRVVAAVPVVPAVPAVRAVAAVPVVAAALSVVLRTALGVSSATAAGKTTPISPVSPSGICISAAVPLSFVSTSMKASPVCTSIASLLRLPSEPISIVSVRVTGSVPIIPPALPLVVGAAEGDASAEGDAAAEGVASAVACSTTVAVVLD